MVAGLLRIGQRGPRSEGPATFGALARPRGQETQRDAVVRLEQAIGRTLGGVRVFKRWDDAFPTDFDRWLRAGGRTLYLSVKSQRADGAMIPWRHLADAPIGSSTHVDLVSWAHAVRDFGAPVYFTLDHEPEGNQSVSGTPEDFIAAWRRVVTVFRERGASNARFTPILTAWTYARTDGHDAEAWYPGDGFVDAIGADGYNWFGCRPGRQRIWRSFHQIFEPVRVFAAQHPGKEVVIGEWGAVEDPTRPGRKADWIRRSLRTLSSPGWEQFRAVLYYHAAGHVGDPPCRFWVDSSQSSLAAFAAIGSDPHFSAD